MPRGIGGERENFLDCRMLEIVPAILTADFTTLEREVRAAERFATFLQLDITDGRFVPTTSITSADIASIGPRIPFEIHLMLERPEEVLQDYLAVGAKRIILHRSSTDQSHELFKTITGAGCEAGLAVSPSTLATEYLPLLPLVQQMTFVAVELGYQGGVLIPGALQHARTFHRQHPEIPMEIDGGIKETNIRGVLKVGADRLVVGSGIWKTADPEATYRRLVALAKGNVQEP